VGRRYNIIVRVRTQSPDGSYITLKGTEATTFGGIKGIKATLSVCYNEIFKYIDAELKENNKKEPNGIIS